VLVHVPANTLVEAPIHVVFATIGDADPVVSHPRSLFVVDSGGSAVVIEQHIGLGDGSYWSNAVSEAVVGPNARLAHYKLQQESRAASHIATIAARQAADSTFRSHAVSLGGRLVRNDIATRFEQRGGECSFDGLYLLDGEQHVDHHTTIDHAQPQCTSDELYKGILGGRATAVFNGKVIVRPDAQKTDAHQMNKNLLLSERAEIDTKPQLEIFADDVKCSHGATVGRLDDESLFFLRSRGIDENEARNLLTFAFANEIVERIDVAPWRERLESLIRDRFASGSLDSINPEQKIMATDEHR
jgi:Fe-S cluster assembly protein SufD